MQETYMREFNFKVYHFQFIATKFIIFTIIAAGIQKIFI